MTKLIAQAATWASQEFFPADPIFFGPVVEADVMYAGFIASDVRFHTLLANIQSGSESSLGAFNWGAPVEKFAEWAATIKRQPRPAFRKGPHDTGTSESAKRDRANSDTSEKNNLSSASQGSAFDMEKEPAGDWWYGVAVGITEGVYREWSSAKAQVHRYSGAKVKKFRSTILADEYV